MCYLAGAGGRREGGGRREELHGAGRSSTAPGGCREGAGGCYEPAMRGGAERVGFGAFAGGGLPQVGLQAHKTHRDSGNPLKSLRFAGLDENPTGLDSMQKCEPPFTA